MKAEDVSGGDGGDGGGGSLEGDPNVPRLAPTSSGTIRVSNPLAALRSSIMSRASTHSNSDLTQTLSLESVW